MMIGTLKYKIMGRKYLGTKQVNVQMLPVKHIIENVREHAMNLSLKEINKKESEKYFKVLVWFRFVSGGEVEKDFSIHYTYALSQEDAKRKVTIEHYQSKQNIPFKWEVNQLKN